MARSQPVWRSSYRRVFGWQVEQMPGVDYWRIQTGSTETKSLHGGLTYRAIPDLNGWMLYVNVASLDETVELVQRLVRPRASWAALCPGNHESAGKRKSG